MTLRNATLFWATVGLWWIYRRYGSRHFECESKVIENLKDVPEKSFPQSPEITEKNQITFDSHDPNASPLTLPKMHTLTPFEILPIEIFQIVLQYLEYCDILNFDNALLNHAVRDRYLAALHNLNLFSLVPLKTQQVQWMIARNYLHRTLILDTLTDVELEYIIFFRNDITSIFSPSATQTDLLKIGACPSMKAFSFPDMINPTLESLLKFNPQLEKLEIPMSPALSPNTIEMITVSCRNLQHLNVSENRWFNDQSIFEIIAFHPPLKSLLFRLTSVSKAHSISNLLEAYPNIYSVACYTRRLPFDSNLLVLRDVTQRSLMSDVPSRQLLGLEALSFLLSDVGHPKFHLVYEELMKFPLPLVTRLNELLSNQSNEEIVSGCTIIIHDLLTLTTIQQAKTLFSSRELGPQILEALYHQPDAFIWFFSDINYSYLFLTTSGFSSFLNFLLEGRKVSQSLTLSLLEHVTFANSSVALEAFIETNFISKVFNIMIETKDTDLLLTCANVLTYLFCKVSFVIPVEPSAISFVSQIIGDRETHKVEYITSLLTQIIINSSNLYEIIGLGLMSSFLTATRDHDHEHEEPEDHAIQCLLDIIQHLTTVRIYVKNRKDEVMMFLNHLVEYGLLSYLVRSVIWKYEHHPFLQTFTELIHLTIPQQEIVEFISNITTQVQHILKLDESEKYMNLILECDIPPQLLPLFFEDL